MTRAEQWREHRGMTEFTAPQPVAPAPPAKPEDTQRRRSLAGRIERETWASLAIAAIWIAVLFTGVFAPDFVSTDAGGSSTTIPSVIPVAIFAWLATSAVAKVGFGRRD
jgi:hypothetical protein